MTYIGLKIIGKAINISRIIEGLTNSKNIKIILDSGADVSLITLRLIEEFNLPEADIHMPHLC